MAVRSKKKSKSRELSPQQRAAITRARNRAEKEKRDRARARKAAETRARNRAAKEEAHKRRVAASKKGARRRKARERAAAALETFVAAVDRKTREHELSLIKESWHRAKAELEEEYSADFDRYMGILEDLADEAGTDWDIGYGSTESAA